MSLIDTVKRVIPQASNPEPQADISADDFEVTDDADADSDDEMGNDQGADGDDSTADGSSGNEENQPDQQSGDGTDSPTDGQEGDENGDNSESGENGDGEQESPDNDGQSTLNSFGDEDSNSDEENGDDGTDSSDGDEGEDGDNKTGDGNDTDSDATDDSPDSSDGDEGEDGDNETEDGDDTDSGTDSGSTDGDDGDDTGDGEDSTEDGQEDTDSDNDETVEPDTQPTDPGFGEDDYEPHPDHVDSEQNTVDQEKQEQQQNLEQAKQELDKLEQALSNEEPEPDTGGRGLRNVKFNLDADATGGDQKRWDEATSRKGTILPLLKTHLQRSRRDSWKRGQNKGRLDSKRLHSIKAKRLDVMKKRDTGDDKKYSAIIVLDRSGSMNGNRIELAEDALVTYALSLEELGIDVMMMDMYQNTARVISPFGVDIEQAKGDILTRDTGGTTPLSDVIEVARKRMEFASNTPFMISITDGAPDNTQRYRDELSKTLMPVMGITIGSNVNTHEQFYDAHRSVTTQSELEQQLEELTMEIAF